MRDHGIVRGVGVFGDVEILLYNAPRIREERPMRADTAAKFVGLYDVVGADRNQPAITNLHLAVKLDKSLSLPTILRAVAAAAQDDDHRILSLQLRELSALCGVVGKFVGRERPRLGSSRIACEVLPGLLSRSRLSATFGPAGV